MKKPVRIVARGKAKREDVTVADHLRLMAPELRAIVEGARRTVKAAVPAAMEIACQTKQPRSSRPMWKIARYFQGDVDVAAIGTFSTHAHLYFQRGAELENGSGLLEGGGKALRSIRLTSAQDAARPEVKRIIRSAFQLASRSAVGKDSREGMRGASGSASLSRQRSARGRRAASPRTWSDKARA